MILDFMVCCDRLAIPDNIIFRLRSQRCQPLHSVISFGEFGFHDFIFQNGKCLNRFCKELPESIFDCP